ncbi:(2Fe-2S) ferredoxin domain-containing protein [Nocardia sp. 2]|uniref:(2Fe-2S) ferredoxin domain-containing protein n=1 Tax=Nocardia acididurans TaxID=2802282 RepID=A0ABS1M9F8_9NOCA|nr:(2Fe-2S) ferredoxin domain-containing protein [Nocardia acididurans]MBL1076389.1 (2Fe-2S) ferredoxin domain-containing protein [Nocardia acididurans]
MTRRHILVARPTPSGVDIASVERLARSCGIGYALLDQDEPTIHDALDDAARTDQPVTLIPLAVPRDRYLDTWIARAVANWKESRDRELDIRITESIDTAGGFTDLIRTRMADEGAPVTASPRAFRSPAWSEIPEHTAHILVCRGPRCTVYGAAALHRELRREHPDALITPTGCLTPCNLGPLYITYPDGRWHSPSEELDNSQQIPCTPAGGL